MRFWSHADSLFPLPGRHRYPLGKYAMLRDAVRAEGLGEIVVPAAAPWVQIERAHDPAFVARMRRGELDRREERVLGLPWSPELVERSRRGIGGTIAAARDALGGARVGMMLGGGTHHAGVASARGFCLFNDVAILLAELRRAGEATRLLVVDCDVHQGDGTAEMLGRDPGAYTLSVQCVRNYPFTRIPSDLDVELPAGVGNDDYLSALEAGLERARHDFGTPDLVCFLAGADPWEGDALGRMALTKPGLQARDELVLDFATGRDVPVVVTLAGGYPPDLRDGVEINLQTARQAARRARAPLTGPGGPGLRA